MQTLNVMRRVKLGSTFICHYVVVSRKFTTCWCALFRFMKCEWHKRQRDPYWAIKMRLHNNHVSGKKVLQCRMIWWTVHTQTDMSTCINHVFMVDVILVYLKVVYLTTISKSMHNVPPFACLIEYFTSTPLVDSVKEYPCFNAVIKACLFEVGV